MRAGVRSLGVLSALLAAAQPCARAAAPGEADLKAVYILNILRFANLKSPAPGERTLTVCVVNPGPVAEPLKSLEGTQVGAQKLRILEDPRGGPHCGVYFFGRTSGNQSQLDAARGRGALTIGNDAEFLSAGGAVALLVENRRIVIEVALGAVKASQWTLAAQLLQIARVTPGGRD